MLDVTAMLLATSSACLAPTVVMAETTTAMPTLSVDSGAQSMTPWSPTSTPLLEPFTPATGDLDTGRTVTVAVARTTPFMLIPTCSALKTGIIFLERNYCLHNYLFCRQKCKSFALIRAKKLHYHPLQ